MAVGLLTFEELQQAWPVLSDEERRDGFLLLSQDEAQELFESLDARGQAALILSLPESTRRAWMRSLAPDDAADLIQCIEAEGREDLLKLLDPVHRREVTALMAYAEDEAGGLMNPRFGRLRPDMTVDEAIAYLRRQTYERIESIHYAYVLDSAQHLLGVVSLGELIAASPERRVRDVMETDLVTVREETDQEEVGRLIALHDLLAVPVLDAENRMKGVITIDDIVDVVDEEATEDMHKLGGAEALDAPYLEVTLGGLLRKRVGWLCVLLLMEFGAVGALRYFDEAMSAATALVLFLPLIIASGGNSGSQAATLVVRAMALGEVRLRDWWRVARREIAMGLMLGASLGILGGATVFGMHFVSPEGLGEHYALLGLTVGFSVVCVALWGTLVGSMLPFGLRRLGLDPASASAPLLATIVDATGLLIYFSVAGVVLHGTLL